MTTVRVVSNNSRYGQDVTIRQFQLAADEPPTLGGDDLGPTPFEWTLTGLGTCKAITLKMYAERKGWNLEQVAVDLTYESHDGTAMITAHLTLTGDLNDEQRERLREISDRCPVHKLLSNPVQIQTQLVDASGEPPDTNLAP
ncbi:MAG: OsmC family protein [Leptolyngbya sp. SIOISBB]|nr:OsmC family protein [Leptolyngbya sp. SIOISBB]